MDVQERIASFDDRVEVLRVRNDGPSDQLTCQLLLIHFVRPTVVLPATPAAAESPTVEWPGGSTGATFDVRQAVGTPADSDSPRRVRPASGRGMAMEVDRIVATGNPVMLHAVSVGGELRGERLEYSVSRSLLHLEDSQSAMLEQAGQRIEAPAAVPTGRRSVAFGTRLGVGARATYSHRQRRRTTGNVLGRRAASTPAGRPARAVPPRRNVHPHAGFRPV